MLVMIVVPLTVDQKPRTSHIGISTYLEAVVDSTWDVVPGHTSRLTTSGVYLAQAARSTLHTIFII